MIDLNEFKESLKGSMIQNYKNDGYLTPVIFYLDEGKFIISKIPEILFNSDEGKNEVSSLLHLISQKPTVTVVGMIYEAYMTKQEKDNELIKLLENGSLRVSELKEKQDVLILLFSTFESETMIMVEVNSETKEIGEITENNTGGGRFSGFFNINKN